MDFFQAPHIEAIEQKLSRRLVAQFRLSLRTLTYDGTNVFTFHKTLDGSWLSAWTDSGLGGIR